MISNSKYKLTIGWLYPELMSTYGDRGNIIVLTKRCEWRDIKVEVKKLDVGFYEKDLASCDLLFMGGAQDRQQKIVADDLAAKKVVLSNMISDGIPGLYICGAYQFLGNYYKEADGIIINGLGIFDLYTESPGPHKSRLIGNIVIQSSLFSSPSRGEDEGEGEKHEGQTSFVGFENHGGRTYLGPNIKPFGSVTVGFGNNGQDSTEGAHYKNSFGTYLHGPILPKNPHFADLLIELALEKKTKTEVKLKKLDDSLERQAHSFIEKKLSF